MIYINGVDTPPNIVINVKDYTPTGVEVLPPMMEFVVKAALTHPAWTFEVARLNIRNDTVQTQYATRVLVYDAKKISLGRIELSNWLWSCDTVEFYNERISRALERGNYKRTSKQDVALKIVNKYFSEPSMVEVMGIASNNIANKKAIRVNELRRNKVQAESVLLAALREYIVDNIDELWGKTPQFANPQVMQGFTLDKFKDTMEEYDIGTGVAEAELLTVVIRGDKYMVQRGAGPLYVTTSDQLAENVRRAIGMLKLVEDGSFIRDTGFRASATTFCVVDTEEKQ